MAHLGYRVRSAGYGCAEVKEEGFERNNGFKNRVLLNGPSRNAHTVTGDERERKGEGEGERERGRDI